MMETVSAQALQSSSNTGTPAPALEPGAEVRAKVEANLPNGIVRLAMAAAKMDLRVSAPLPVGADVVIAVSGSKKQPLIKITPQVPQTASAQTSPPPQQVGQSSATPPSGQTPATPLPASGHLLPKTSLPLGQMLQAGAPPIPTAPSPASPGVGQAAVSGQGAAPLQGRAQAGGSAPQGAATPNAGQTVQGSTASQAVPQSGASTNQTANNPAGPTVTAPPTGTAPASGNSGVAQGNSLVTGGPAQPVASQLQSGQPVSSGVGGRSAVNSIAGPSSPAISTQAIWTPPGSTGPGGTPQQGPMPSGSTVGSVPTSPAATGNPPAGTSVTPPLGAAPPVSAGKGAQQMPSLGGAVTPQSGLQSALPSNPVNPPQVSLPTSQPGPSGSTPVSQQTTAGQMATPLGSGKPLGPTQASVPAKVPVEAYVGARGLSAGPATSAKPAVQTPLNALQQAAETLRQPLAEQQAGLGNLFAQIGALVSAQTSGQAKVPDAVQRAMQQILGLRLNSAQPLDGKTLQQGIKQTGQFREANLQAQGSGTATGGQTDLKSALLSFRSLLQQFGADPKVTQPARQPTVPSKQSGPQSQPQQTSSGFWQGGTAQNLQSLMQETDAALARMRLTQLVNTGLASDDAPQTGASRPMDAVFELPLALGQETAVLQMQVGRDGSGNGEEQDGEPAWRLRFALDLTATGPLEAAVSLRGGGTYVSLWVDRKETLDALSDQRETMEAAFAHAGLDLQELRLMRGLPPKTAAKYGALINRQS